MRIQKKVQGVVRFGKKQESDSRCRRKTSVIYFGGLTDSEILVPKMLLQLYVKIGCWQFRIKKKILLFMPTNKACGSSNVRQRQDLFAKKLFLLYCLYSAYLFLLYCLYSAYLSSGHRTASDANVLDDPHTFHYQNYFVIGGIRTCLRASDDPMFLWISSNPPSRNDHRKASYPS